MHTQAHFSKGSSSQHFASSVEVWGGLWRISFLQERLSDHAWNVYHLSGSRWEFAHVAYGVATRGNELGDLLWRYLADLESLFGDVDRVCDFKIKVQLLLSPVVVQSLATVTPVQSFLSEGVGGTWGASSHVLELMHPLEALSKAFIDTIWHIDISHIDIIMSFVCVIQNFEAWFDSQLFLWSSSSVEVTLQIIVIAWSIYKPAKLACWLLLICVEVTLLVGLVVVRMSFGGELACLGFWLLIATSSTTILEDHVVCSHGRYRAHWVLLIPKIWTLHSMIGLIVLAMWVLSMLYISILLLALSWGNVIVLINEDHLLVLMFSFQNWGMPPVCLRRLYILLMMGQAFGIVVLWWLLLDDDIALRPQVLPQVSACLIIQNLLSFLLMMLVATANSVGIRREIGSKMAWGYLAHLLRVLGLVMANRQIIFAHGIVSRAAHVASGWVNGSDSLSCGWLRSQRLVAMRYGTANDLLHGGGWMVVVVDQIRSNMTGGLEGRAWVDAKHLLLTIADHGGLVLSMSRLA